MATAAEIFMMSAWSRRHWQNRTALALSSPRVELSQHCSKAPIKADSAMLTRFLSPPLTPRTKSSPTLVLAVCEMEKTDMTTSQSMSATCAEENPEGNFRIGRVDAAKRRVSRTVR